MDTEISEEEALWGSSPVFGGNIPRLGRTAGKQNSKGPCTLRYTDRNTTEVWGIGRDRIHQGEKRNSDSPDVSREGETRLANSLKVIGYSFMPSYRISSPYLTQVDR
jgi:hypothetical protein